MDADQYKLMNSLEENHWWFVSRRKIIDQVLAKFVSKGDVLEVGCGSGGNFSLLAKYGSIDASELNQEAIENARNKNIANSIKCNSLPEEEPFEGKKYDLVAMFDVLEHIDEDKKVIALLKNKLKDEGKLVLTVPAIKFLWSKHDEECHHKRRYNKKQFWIYCNLKAIR